LILLLISSILSQMNIFGRFSRLIQQTRRRLGESQADVARRVGVSQQLVSRIEAGGGSWEQLVGLAKTLGLGVEIRLGGQSEWAAYPLDADERREIEANIDWFSRRPPLERLRAIAQHMKAARQLQELGRHGR